MSRVKTYSSQLRSYKITIKKRKISVSHTQWVGRLVGRQVGRLALRLTSLLTIKLFFSFILVFGFPFLFFDFSFFEVLVL